MKKLLIMLLSSLSIIISCKPYDALETVEKCDADHIKHNLTSEIDTIIIEGGNGKIGIRYGDTNSYSIPEHNFGRNIFNVSGKTLRISLTCHDSYITINEFSTLIIEDDNSTTTIDPYFATGTKLIDMNGNSTVKFGDVCGSSPISPSKAEDPYNLNLIIQGNSSFYASDLKIKNADINILQNGHFYGFNAETEIMDLNVTGNGTVEVFVRDSLNVVIIFNGMVYYKGYPSISLIPSTNFDNLINSN